MCAGGVWSLRCYLARTGPTLGGSGFLDPVDAFEILALLIGESLPRRRRRRVQRRATVLDSRLRVGMIGDR